MPEDNDRLERTMEDSAHQMDTDALRIERERLIWKDRQQGGLELADTVGLEAINRELARRGKQPLGPM